MGKKDITNTEDRRVRKLHIEVVQLICTSSAAPEEYTIYGVFSNSRVAVEIGSLTVGNKRMVVRCCYGTNEPKVIMDMYYPNDDEFCNDNERIRLKQQICDFILNYIKNEIL